PRISTAISVPQTLPRPPKRLVPPRMIAAMILGTLNNGLTLMNVSSFWQDVTRGVVLLLAVGLDQLRLRLQG
ncbi:hypothetical protein AB9F46_35180, partial [Rhizobium leguminosarum]